MLTTCALFVAALPPSPAASSTALAAPAGTPWSFEALTFEPLAVQGRKPVLEDSEPRLAWKFVEVNVQMRDADLIDDDLPGLGLRGAWEFDQGFFLRAGVSHFTDDNDLTRYDLGFGQSVPLEDGLKAFASISWVHVEFDRSGGGSADEDGWRVDLGARTLLDERLELEARIGWVDVGDDGFLFGADLRYWFVGRAAMGVGYERENDDDILTLGLRYAF
ncbi:MAG: hypothetical protein JNK02_11205 [Planctomycetes bacterium]|nr:hypothetical protein [Planctomycetota bacterium]